MTEALWTVTETADATKGQLKGQDNWEAIRVSIDSRDIQSGDLFIAIKGEKFDGHEFVGEALKNGAVAAIVSNIPEGLNEDTPLVLVKDTMAALEDLGKASRARTQAKIIGITGSVGKTGTKAMLATVLEALNTGPVHASIKSFNNHFGVPLTLANMPKETKFGVFEMGMNHAGELAALTAQVKPDIAIITTIEPVHIEHFDGIEGITDAKAEIFSSMDANGTVILNFDNPQFLRLKQAAEKQGIRNIVTFGEDDEADIILTDCTLKAQGSSGEVSVFGTKHRVKLNISGKHILHNALSVLGVVHVLGEDVATAAKAMSDAEPPEGRGMRHEIVIEDGKPPVFVIDESYNASPASMEAAFEVLAGTEPKGEGRRIAVLGDMLELGPTGPQLHIGLANPLLHAKTDKLFACGNFMEALYAALPPDWQGGHAKESQALCPIVTEALNPGDVVLVKGSNGSKMAYVVQAILDMDVSAQSGEQKHAL